MGPLVGVGQVYRLWHMIIYLATNRLNGKKYVGQTRFTLSKRWGRHLTRARCKSGAQRTEPFVLALRKYGREAFDIIEIDTATNLVELGVKEWFYASMLGTYVPNGYNLQTCGHHPTPHEETIKKRSKTYQFISPKGELVTVTNLAAFCREQRLDQCHMYHVAQGKRVAHKGWRTMKQKHRVCRIKHQDTGEVRHVIDAYGFKRQLANELGMDDTALIALVGGRIRSSRRWVLLDTTYTL